MVRGKPAALPWVCEYQPTAAPWAFSPFHIGSTFGTSIRCRPQVVAAHTAHAPRHRRFEPQQPTDRQDRTAQRDQPGWQRQMNELPADPLISLHGEVKAGYERHIEITLSGGFAGVDGEVPGLTVGGAGDPEDGSGDTDHQRYCREDCEDAISQSVRSFCRAWLPGKHATSAGELGRPRPGWTGPGTVRLSTFIRSVRGAGPIRI